MTMHLRRRHFLILAALAAVLITWQLWAHFKDDKSPTFEHAQITTGTIEETVSAQGKLEPRDYVDVGAQVSGQLDKLLVQAGDTVSASQLVAEIDPRVYEARLQQADASLKSLKAQMAEQQAALNLAKQQHARNATMVASQAISKQEFDISLAAVKAAQARVGAIAAQTEQATSAQSEERTNLGFTKIYAPMGGTVISTSIKAGQTINASQQAPTLIQIANLGTMTVRAQVAEADVSRLKENMPVTFTTLGAERKWSGTVRQILPAPETVNDVVLYNVLVDAANPEGKLMSGMSTQMTFLLAEAKNVPTLPVAALGRKVAGAPNTYRVKVANGNKTEEKQVVVGLMNRTVAEIKSGLSVGDTVILATPATDEKTGGQRGGGMGRNMGPRL